MNAHVDALPATGFAGGSTDSCANALLDQLAGLRGRAVRAGDPLGCSSAPGVMRKTPLHAAHRRARPASIARWRQRQRGRRRESYMDGEWDCADLVGLVRLLVRNRDLLDAMERGLAARIGGWAMRGWNGLRRNTRDGSRRNIAAHYDLGNDFFGCSCPKT
jgi:cyclopropane-fatty-acyl-phospholipid synthase